MGILDQEMPFQKFSECGVYIPWDRRTNKLTAFCRSHGQIDSKSPHFYQIVPKWPQSVLSHWFRIHDDSCHDVNGLILTFFHQKNFKSNGCRVYYHWFHRVLNVYTNTATRRQRQSSFFTELRHHLTIKNKDPISASDDIVAVTFEFETNREEEGPTKHDGDRKLIHCTGCSVTTTFTLFSNGYYWYKKRGHIHCWIVEDRCGAGLGCCDYDYTHSYDLKFPEHRGIWDYKANRIMMEGIALNDDDSEDEEEEEDFEIGEDWDYEDEHEWDIDWIDEPPHARYELKDAFGDILVDDETISMSPNQHIEGVTDLFDFFRKEMVIQNSSKVTVYVRGV